MCVFFALLFGMKALVSVRIITIKSILNEAGRAKNVFHYKRTVKKITCVGEKKIPGTTQVLRNV